MNTDMSMSEHDAIESLIDLLDTALPNVNLSSADGSSFMGAVALYRCNRFLRAISSAVDSGLGDTAGGNLRTLYDTWVYGHLLMLGNVEEAQIMWGKTRGQAEKLLRAIGADDDVQYPDSAPEALADTSVEQRARSLEAILTKTDPENAGVPHHCYDFIYRSESHLSSHANLDSINQYAVPIGDSDGTIGLNAKNEGCEWRTCIAAYITAYFAEQVFTRLGLDTKSLIEVSAHFDPPTPRMDSNE